MESNDVARGYIGLTDPDWYSFLSKLPQVDEVNFWQPHGNQSFRAVTPGEPYFFKLRAPLRAIAGFGFFERFEILPVWLAWECFQEMNGAPNIEELLDRLLKLRGDQAGSFRRGDFKIGCVMIKAPVFFSKEEWVNPPRDWPTTGVQKGKRYSVLEGEGKRVFEECLDRAQKPNRYWNVERSPGVVPPGSARYGNPIPVRPRLGQGLFSLAVREAYSGSCAVTGEHSDPVLEAAHIMPYAAGGEHRIDNGLLLRSDLHRLYDRGYVTVTPDNVFLVGDSLRRDFSNGRSYYAMNGKTITVPTRENWKPNQEWLDWHWRNRFKDYGNARSGGV